MIKNLYLLNDSQLNIDTFPPTGTVITTGDFSSGTGWETPINGSSISGGTGNVIGGSSGGGGGGSITFSAGNWSLRQNSIFAIDGTTTYTVKFKARATGGSTGKFQVGRGYDAYFDQTITTAWVNYEVTFGARSDAWADDLTIGADVTGETFEIDEISAVAD